MYAYFQPRISVAQEEADIKARLMKNMNAKSKKSVIITNKWKKIITNK